MEKEVEKGRRRKKKGRQIIMEHLSICRTLRLRVFLLRQWSQRRHNSWPKWGRRSLVGGTRLYDRRPEGPFVKQEIPPPSLLRHLFVNVRFRSTTYTYVKWTWGQSFLSPLLFHCIIWQFAHSITLRAPSNEEQSLGIKVYLSQCVVKVQYSVRTRT